MTRFILTLEYDGTDLIGWQENRQGPSVQSVVKDAIEKFCGARPDVVGAGRTDAGVHAVAMTAHCDIPGDHSAQTVMRALNFYLVNQPVSVLDCKVVHDDFNARFDCVARFKPRLWRFSPKPPTIASRSPVSGSIIVIADCA